MSKKIPKAKKKAIAEKTKFYAVVAVTIDGFIARYSGHKTGWTSKEDKKQLHEKIISADVLVLGHKTFELSKKWLEKRNCIVLSGKTGGIGKKNELLVFLNPEKIELKKFVEKQHYKKVCVLGGSKAYTYCIENDLLDEIFLTIEPIVFGKGITMFSKKVETKNFRLVSLKKLNKKGSLLLHYKKRI